MAATKKSGRTQDPAPWRPSGVVSLLTDFGERDPYVGIMKGVLLGIARGAAIVDLTHALAPQDVRAAAFYLEHSWRWFPAGSVHVAVVDPGVGSARRMLVARAEGQAFLAPDNGLLSGVLSSASFVGALDVERFSLVPRSATFHGRDVFAPAAARIAAGLAPEEAGASIADWQRLDAPRPARDGAGWRSEVVLADRFGNLVTSLTADELDPGAARGWVARAAGLEIPVATTYAAVEPGALLALLDSFGCWEIAVRGGDAAARLALGPGAPVGFHPRPSRATMGER